MKKGTGETHPFSEVLMRKAKLFAICELPNHWNRFAVATACGNRSGRGDRYLGQSFPFARVVEPLQVVGEFLRGIALHEADLRHAEKPRFLGILPPLPQKADEGLAKFLYLSVGIHRTYQAYFKF